jgi:spore germination cell wall hydrolase CwlJ-like protein
LTPKPLAIVARAYAHAIAICAAAFVLFVTLAPTKAEELLVAEVVPASISNSIQAKRLQPKAAPVQVKLTPELLQAYVVRQQQLKSFSFDVEPKELTEDVLLGYIARTKNPALEAIGKADSTGKPALNTEIIAEYAEASYVPTVKKVKLADDERLCLTQAIYHEARGESVEGQWAVANIIINRAMNKRYPSTICGVVFQNAEKGFHRCQFTFACDGRSDMGTERKAWNRAQDIADGAFAEFQHGTTPGVLPKSALFYHTRAVSPDWSNTYKRVAAIGSHVFYSPL